MIAVSIYHDCKTSRGLINRSFDLFLIPGCMISNSLYLSLASFYASSLWRTADTAVFAKLNKPPVSINPPPHSNVFELNTPPGGGGGNRGLTVCIWRCSWIGDSCPSTSVLYTIINLQYVYESTRHIWGIKKVEIFVDFHKVLASRWRVAVQSTNPDNPIGKPRLFLSAIHLVVYHSSFSFTDNLW